MDWIWVCIGLLLILLAFAGSIFPIIPGPLLAYIGLLIGNISDRINFSNYTLIGFGLLIVVITILEFVIPALATKKFGGSKSGEWGSTIGAIMGIFFFPPVGIIIGTMLGALTGELIAGNNIDQAIKSSIGSFFGFLAGTFMKLILCTIILLTFVWELI